MRTFAALAAMALCAAPAMAQPATDADAKAAATTVSEAFAKAYNDQKPAGIASLFTKDGVYITPAATVLHDHADIEKAIAARQEAGWTKEAINVVEAHAIGDGVWALVTYDLEGTGKQANKRIGGYAVQVLKRDGADWRLASLIGNLRMSTDVTGMGAVKADK